MTTQELVGADDQGSRSREAFLREQAVRLALAGYSLDEALNHFFGERQARQDEIDQQAEQRTFEIVERQARIQEKLEQTRDAQKSAKELLEKRQALEAERQTIQSRLARLGAIIRSKRRQGRAAAIASQAARRIERARREPEERLEVELDIRRKLYKIEEACWEVNKPEYERRTQILQEEISRIDKELEPQKNRVEKLKNQGITRTVAGFLVWAGYLGFAATGSAVSYVLYQRIPETGGSPSKSIVHFIAQLEQYGITFGPLGGVLIPIFFLLLLLSAFVGVVWGCDIALKKFDSRWTGGPKKRKARPDRQVSESIVGSPLAQFFQLPFIERASFVQLLAAVPYLFAAGVLFLLMSTSGSPSTGDSRDLVQSLAPKYIGAVYALLATAASILYALYIVLPRMERAAGRPSGEGRLSLVKTNWELVMLLCALILALAIAALAPDSAAPGDVYSRVTWGSIAIAMTISSMGLAYGLIFIGQFKDIEKGERMRRQVRTAIESFGARPTIEIGSLLDLEAVRNHLNDMQDEEDSFEFIRTIYETTIAFSDEPGDFSNFLDLWLKAVEPKNKVRGLFNRSKLVDSLRTGSVDTLDFEHAPEESSEVHEINLKLLQCDAELRRIDLDLAAFQATNSSPQEDQKELEQLQAAERVVKVELESRKRVFEAQRRQEELLFRAAFGLGKRFRRPDPAPIPSMPPAGGGELPLN